VPPYRERLRLPLSWVAGALVVALIAAAQLHTALTGWAGAVPYLVLLPGVVLGALALSRREVRVEDGALHVPGARAPLTVFGPPEVLQGQALQHWMGPLADPHAWVATSPWLRGAVRLPVLDPADDTPYWLVGSRDPVALAAALS
jgi:hypothetical protein